MPNLTIPLAAEGPIVEVALLVSGPRQSALMAARQPVPPAYRPVRQAREAAANGCYDGEIVPDLWDFDRLYNEVIQDG